MIINTGCRTDIPAYFSEWFFKRIKEGYVYVKNPYYQNQVMKYKLTPDVVDCIAFCTKNPAPMLPRIHELNILVSSGLLLLILMEKKLSQMFHRKKK